MYKSIQSLLLNCLCFSIAIATLLSCSSAKTEELSGSGVFGGHTPAQETKTIKPRRVYIDARLFEAQRIRAAEGQMRVASQTLSRLFFFNANELESSFSIGDTRDGFLIQGKALPSPSLLLRQLPVQYERGLAYGSNELIEVLVDTARLVDKRHPDSVMFLGNLGLREGGDIPYSISHNAGRDADIAFFTRKKGKGENQVENLLKFNRSLTAQDSSGQVYQFDLERNASLFEFLLSHPKHDVQFIFVAKHIRQAIYKTLAERSVSAEILERFTQVVWDDAGHADHCHIRLYCSAAEICAGCIDRSVLHPWHKDPVPIREACVEKHYRKLRQKKAEPMERAAAIQRLALLDATEHDPMLILKHLSDEHVEVRRATILAAGRIPGAGVALGKQLALETDPSARLDILRVLSKLADDECRQQLRQRLLAYAEKGTALGEGSDEEISVILKYYRHQPNIEAVLPILDILQKSQDKVLSHELRTTVAIITNHDFCQDLAISNAVGQDLESQNFTCSGRYQRWLEGAQQQSRRQWVIAGMQRAGFKVKSLENKDIVALLDAIDGPMHVSINAQIELRRIAKLDQDSIDWSTADARWHYTRYFKKRQKKYKIDLSDRNERGLKL